MDASVGALIIAHTHPQRALLPLGGGSLLSRMVETCRSVGADPIIVTVNGLHAPLAASLSGLDVQLLPVDHDTDMFTAVQQGITFCPETLTRLFISHVSIPSFSAPLLCRMLRCDRPVCRPERNGIGLHPVLLTREAMEEVAAYRGADGLRGALRAFPEDAVCRLSVDETETNNGFRPEISVRLTDSAPFFGPGPRQLLLGIRARGSVLKACEAVGLSYSKGRALLRRMEEALGTTLVSRTQGGAGGGSAILTEAGETFLSRYACYEQAVADYAAAVFSDYFPRTDSRETEDSLT